MNDITTIKLVDGDHALRIDTTNYLNVCLCDCSHLESVVNDFGLPVCPSHEWVIPLKRLIEKDIKMVLMYRDTDGTIKPLRPELIK